MEQISCEVVLPQGVDKPTFHAALVSAAKNKLPVMGQEGKIGCIGSYNQHDAPSEIRSFYVNVEVANPYLMNDYHEKVHPATLQDKEAGKFGIIFFGLEPKN